MSVMTEVVAALIIKNGRFLICQRPEDKARPLLWEFVGGKVEPGESLEEALIRECREELGIELRVTGTVTDTVHEYPDISIHLTLLSAEIAEGEPKLLEHRALAWITPEEVNQYEFCPADVEFAERLAYLL